MKFIVTKTFVLKEQAIVEADTGDEAISVFTSDGVENLARSQTQTETSTIAEAVIEPSPEASVVISEAPQAVQ